MKNSFASLLLALGLVAGSFLAGCKSKVNDTEIRTSAQTVIQNDPGLSGVSVDITDGVATLSGQVQDEAAKTSAEDKIKDVKGVKSVKNNITVMAAAPVEVTADDPLTVAVRDAVKDHPGVNATVNDGVITLTGTIKRNDLQTLMQKLNGLNPKKVENNLTIQ